MFRTLAPARILIGLCLFSLSFFLVHAGEVPSFPPHPRLATTVDELNTLKQSPARKDQAVREAEALLKTTVKIPEGWGHACPDDASPLHVLNEKEHQCPRSSKVHKDEKIGLPRATSSFTSVFFATGSSFIDFQQCRRS